MPIPQLTFVTTCKGRLNFLKSTLPSLLAQPDADCVVVDYDCPDRCGDWVEAMHAGVKVVRWPHADTFNPAHARNLGVAAANTDVVCLIDSDVMPQPEFTRTVLAAFDPRSFYVPEPFTGDLSGTMVCARAAFAFVDGYDEACTGWGGEDLDLYDRFEFHGLRRSSFPADLLRVLPHSDAARTAHHALADKELSNSINLIYSHIKLDLMRLSASKLPTSYRRALHAQVHAACLASIGERIAVPIEIPFSESVINFCAVDATLRYLIGIDAARGEPAAPALRHSGGTDDR